MRMALHRLPQGVAMARRSSRSTAPWRPDELHWLRRQCGCGIHGEADRLAGARIEIMGGGRVHRETSICEPGELGNAPFFAARGVHTSPF